MHKQRKHVSIDVDAIVVIWLWIFHRNHMVMVVDSIKWRNDDNIWSLSWLTCFYLPISLSFFKHSKFIIPIFIPTPHLPIFPIQRSKYVAKRRWRSRYRSPACRFIGACILSPHFLQRSGSVSSFNFDFPLRFPNRGYVFCVCTAQEQRRVQEMETGGEGIPGSEGIVEFLRLENGWRLHHSPRSAGL